MALRRRALGAQVKAGDVLAFVESPEANSALARHRAAAAREGVARHALERAERLIAIEGISRGERDSRQAEGEAASAEAEVAADLYDARGKLGRAQAALAGPLGIDPAAIVAVGTLGPRVPLPGREEARAQAAARGDVVAIRTQAEQQDLLARAAGRRAIPEPTVRAGRKTATANAIQDQGPIFGISLAFPLFDRGQGARAVAEVEARLLRARQSALESRLGADASAAVGEAEVRREAESTYGPAADPDALVRIARASYEEGEMRILELIDAYRTALAARLRINELRSDARRAEIAVDVATGTERLP